MSQTTALRAVVGVLCLGWIAASAMAACLPYVAADVPVSDYSGGHAMLDQIHGTGKLYVSSRETPRVWVVDQQDLRVLGEIPIRGVGHQMVVLDEQ